MHSPCIDYGSGGEAQEPMQVSWPPLPFLTLCGPLGCLSAGCSDRIVDRAPSPAAVHGTLAVAAQHGQL